jgi:hypothetical protein
MSAANNPTIAKLSALVATIQQVIATLRQQQAQQPVAPAANPVVFADTPQMLEVMNLIDYSTKKGAEIYMQVCAPLNNKSLTEGLTWHPIRLSRSSRLFSAVALKWDGTLETRTSPPSPTGTVTPSTSSRTMGKSTERFCSAAGADSRTRAKQNNKMMSICLAKSLTEDAQARLLTYRKDYLIGTVECAPLMYKVFMHSATID